MISFWGFQDFSIYLAKCFFFITFKFSLFEFCLLIWTSFSKEQCKLNSSINFFIMQSMTMCREIITMRVPKRPFVFSQLNTKFYSCTQMAIRFFPAKYEILRLYPNGHSFFTAKCKILETVPKRPFMFLQRNIEFWKLYPNSHLYFPQGNTKSNNLSSI